MSVRSSRPGRRALRIIAICVAALTVALVALVLLRNPVVEAVAPYEMSKRGIVCDHITASVPLAFPPTELSLGPMRCTSAEGTLRRLRFRTPVVVHLDGLQPGVVQAGAIDVDLRTRPHADVQLDVIGTLMDVVGLEDRFIGLIFDEAALSSLETPRISCGVMRVTRNDELVVTMRGASIRRRGTGMQVSASSADLEGVSSILGPGTVSVWANRNRARGSVGFTNGLRVDFTATGLSTARPAFGFSIGTGTTPPEQQERRASQP